MDPTTKLIVTVLGGILVFASRKLISRAYKYFKEKFQELRVPKYDFKISFLNNELLVNEYAFQSKIESILSDLYEEENFEIKIRRPDLKTLKKKVRKNGKDEVFRLNRIISDKKKIDKLLEKSLKLLFSKPVVDIYGLYTKSSKDWTIIAKKLFEISDRSRDREKGTRFVIWRTSEPSLKFHITLNDQEVNELKEKKRVDHIQQFASGPGFTALDEVPLSVLKKEALARIILAVATLDESLDDKKLKKTISPYTWHVGLS